jgi:2,5-diketo-D-gluconate reductase A
MQDGNVAIPKSTSPERMEQNIAVFGFELSAEEIASIDALDKGESGHVGPNPDTYVGI